MKLFFTTLITLSILASGCVAKKQHLSLMKSNAVLEGRYAKMVSKSDSMQAVNSKLNGEIKNMASNLEGSQSLNKSLQSSFDNYKLSAEQAAKMSESEVKTLNSELRSKIGLMSEYEKTIKEMEATIKKQRESSDQLLSKIKSGLTGFTNDELSVENKDGKIYVSLSESLLFKSGSTAVDPKGVAALKKLTEVLKKQKDVDIVIEGHTDNVPIRTSSIKDNWDLSVLRATSIVRILTQDDGLDPIQIIPSGRSEYLPVVENDSKENKAKNRRTEIILSPRVKELLEILEGR